MPHRRSHIRSKKGCLTCKVRHVRCDERLPYCGQCLRLGRECSYTQTIKQNIPKDFVPEAPELCTASQQALLTKQCPRGFQILYMPPLFRGISSSTIAVIQQSQEIARRRPMPRTCLMTIAQHYTPKYNLLAASHESVRFSIVGFAAYMHYRVTKSALSQQLCIQHMVTALEKLQRDILDFGPGNADAVVTASVFLAGTAQDWNQWAVYVDGYSKALSQIIDRKYQSIYPDFCTSDLPLRHISLQSSPNPSPITIPTPNPNPKPPPPINKPLIYHHIHLVTIYMQNLTPLLTLPRFRAAGFQDLQALALSVDHALEANTEEETFHRLSWLRTWLFWMELRKGGEKREQTLLGGCFWLLVLCIVGLFPEGYRVGLRGVAVERVRGAVGELGEEEEHVEGLGGGGLEELLETIVSGSGEG